MDTQNVTITLQKDILRKAKILAVQRQTSLSALLARTIEDLVKVNDDYELARRKHQALLHRGFNLNTGGVTPGSRASLHER